VTTALIVLLCIEAAATLTFLAVYLPRSDWRDNAVGRHLAYYGIALASIYVGTLVRVVWRVPLSLDLLVLLHGLFAAACVHRVVLVVRQQRGDNNDPRP
jgi:hypothetical protein